jgi:penicillin-binding protein 1A
MKKRIVLFMLILFGVACLWSSSEDVEKILRERKITFSTAVFSEDGMYLGCIGSVNRIECKSLGELSPHVVNALLATEDRTFLSHEGVSLQGLARAAVSNLKGKKQGGSTITMQLARNLYLSPEKTISRKLTEIDLALKLEGQFSKQEILLMYLNTVYFGHGTYGIWTASQDFFSKPPSKLTVPEACTLVGLVKAPSSYDPITNPQLTLKRRNDILHHF